jgi:alpha-tubulin suppressor-like RCC1 family protein
VAFGVHHGALLTTDGKVLTWGTGNHHELGVGKTGKASNPVLVKDLPPIKSVECGMHHTLALSEEGEVFSWGWGGSQLMFQAGALGLGSYSDASTPRKVAGLLADHKISSIAAGGKHSVALSTNGKLFSWGGGELGRLGTGESVNALSPVAVGGLDDEIIVQVDAGASHTAALTSEGLVYTWGQNDNGQLGTEAGMNLDQLACEVAPTLVEGLLSGKKIAQIQCGYKSTLSVTAEGDMYVFGDKKYNSGPVHVTGDNRNFVDNHRVVTATAGKKAFAAVDAQGKLFTWGDNGIALGLKGESQKSPAFVSEVFIHMFVIYSFTHSIIIYHSYIQSFVILFSSGLRARPCGQSQGRLWANGSRCCASQEKLM